VDAGVPEGGAPRRHLAHPPSHRHGWGPARGGGRRPGGRGREGDLIREIWEGEYDAIIDDVGPLDDARALLAALRDRGFRIALASSSIPKHAQRAFDLLDADRYAAVTTTSEDADESKPDSELVAVAMERLGTDNACMVGDAVWDVVAASHTGIPTIGVCCGGYGRQELLDSGAVEVYLGPGDLLAHLDMGLDIAFGVRTG
jgi:phosphoglycolate phosphatase-like HAD superfamily hydrolase